MSFRLTFPFLFLVASAAAQSAPRPTEPAVVLDRFEIAVQKDAGEILPTDRIAGSLFGPARSALESPRAVSILSEEVLREAAVRGLRDLAAVSPNTDTPNTFGVPSLPRIRGQEGEIFQNGQRRAGGNNGFGLPISFNAFDRLDVVKGPPTPVLGPTQRVGGYIDLHTKRPDLDRIRGSVTLEAGSYDFYRGTVDYSTPLTAGRSALRVSWEHLDADSFYDNVVSRSDSLFLAYTHARNDRVRLDYSFEYFDARYSDNAGWNRPTQDLIDHGSYITGIGISPVTGAIPGPRAVIRPTGVVNLPRNRVLTDPDDFSKARTLISQTTLTVRLAPDTTLTNRTFLQSLEKDQVNQNSFVEIVDESYTAENRTELARDFNFSLGGRSFANRSVTGLALRGHRIVGYSQFNTEADAPIDLTAPISTRRIPNSVLPTVLGLNPGVVQLRPGVFVAPGASDYDVDGDGRNDFARSDTNGTDSFQSGLFHQHDLRFDERWSLLAGARFDLLHVKSEDPIPPVGFRAIADSTTQGQGAGNASLVFAPTQRSSAYATYAYSQSVSNGLGGGVPLDGDGRLSSTGFHIASRLFELGTKSSLLDNTLFLSTAAFTQSRNVRNRDGSNSRLNVRGVEGELTYRPSRRFFAVLGTSYVDARFDNGSVSQGTGRVEDAFDNSRPDIVVGTGRGSPNFTVFPAADHRFPGLPRVTANALGSFTLDSGFGGTLGATWTGEQNLDVLGRVVIHPQINVNAALFYRQPRYEFRLDALNATDEKNFSPIFNGFFGADLVLPEEPVRFRASASYRF